MSHRTFNESVRAVGYVHYDSRGSRDAKKPCVIFLQQIDHFAKATAVLILKGVADPNYQMTLCNVPAHVNQLFVQQVQMSTTGDFVSFTCSEASNPDSRTRAPMLFRRVPCAGGGGGTKIGSTTRASIAPVSNNNNNLVQTATYDLEACDNYIKQEDDLNGDALQQLYFPQLVSIGEVGSNHVICGCRAENGTRTCYTVKLQSNNSNGFFNFNFLKRAKKLAAASIRHVPGTDLILSCQHKMSDSPSINMAVRHFSLHTIRNCGNFERIYEVALGPELSRAWQNESLMNGYVFWDCTSAEEHKLMRDLSIGATNAASSNHYHLPKISSVVVAYILYDYPVRSEACGAYTDKEIVYRHVVRLFVFRPRNKNNGYNGSDWYIDLYFSKRNIAIFQISSLGQMCVLCPGYKAYFVDVKYFGHEVGPSVSVVQYLDSNSLAHQSKLKEQNNPSPASATSPPPPPTSSSSPSKAVPIPTKTVGLKGTMENNSNSFNMRVSSSFDQQQQHSSSTVIEPSASSAGGDNTNTEETNNNNNNNNNKAPPATSTSKRISGDVSSSPTLVNVLNIKSPYLEENCFLGERFPDAFLRPNCIPSKLPPVEITSEQGKFVIFYSTHISAVLYLETRKPIWQAAQLALLRDRQRRKASYEKNHDGEHAARGMLSIMDRAAMSLIPGRKDPSFASISSSANLNNSNDNNNINTSTLGLSYSQTASLAAQFPPTSILHTASMSSPTAFHDHATKLEVEDTQFAFLTLTPVFQQMSTQLRDPISLCVEWIIAAAYLRLGTRQNPPPRLSFDFSAYEGIIYPFSLPGTTAHARLRGSPTRTSLITGGTEAAGQQRLVSVHPRDTFVKAVELRLDDTIHYRKDLVKSFRMFIPYEEALIEMMFPAVYHQVKDLIEPSRGNAKSRAKLAHGLGSSAQLKDFAAAAASSTSPNGNNSSTGNPSALPFPNSPAGAAAAANNNNKSSSSSASPELKLVNEFCFLLCRLTALDLVGVRVEEKSPIVTSTMIFIAANHHILPFNALARSIWQRTISNQAYDEFSVMLNPLTRYANKESQRLSVRVNNILPRTTNLGAGSNMGSFFFNSSFNNNNISSNSSNTKKETQNDDEGRGSEKTNKHCTPQLFVSVSEPRRFFPSFSPSLISDKPFSGIPLPSLAPMGSFAVEQRPRSAKGFLKDLRAQFAN